MRSAERIGHDRLAEGGSILHVVITGGAGFVGSHLSEACLSRGWTVTAVDCFTDYYSTAVKRANVSWGTRFDSYTTGNVVALQRMLEAAKSASLRKLVFASSSSVYRDSEQLPTPESDRLAPLSPYGATKVLGEHLCSI